MLFKRRPLIQTDGRIVEESWNQEDALHLASQLVSENEYGKLGFQLSHDNREQLLEQYSSSTIYFAMKFANHNICDEEVN